jgi:outer membrane protein OmpA-like peptidoglycan-associated protein
MALVVSGCSFTESVQTQVVRGTPKITERPVEGATPYVVSAKESASGLDVVVSPARCIATTETPVTKKDTITTTPKWTNSAWWIVGGAALGGLGALVWVQAEDRPEDCPPEQRTCSTRASARTGAAIAWGLGAAAIGYGTYRILKPSHTVTQRETKDVERQAGAPKACTLELAALPVELRIGSLSAASAVTDANGHATLALGAGATALPSLDGAGKGTIFVKGTAAAELDLKPLYAALRAGADAAALERSKSSPFGSTTPVAFALRGSVHLLPQGTSRLPDFARLTSVGQVYTNRLDVGARDDTEGFPGVPDRREWYGIDYVGMLAIQRAGRYRFRLTSDDGARLSIDGKRVVDNDGLHEPSAKEGELSLGIGIHDVRVEYFQGPGSQIALVLEMSAGGEPFSALDVTRYAPAEVSEDDPDTARVVIGEGVLFDLDKAQLRPQAERVLREIKAAIFDARAFTMVTIEGHTDDRGSSSHNLDLSQRRTAAVARFLTNNGVPNGNVYTQALGASRPRVPNTDDDGRAKNRRFEIVLTRPAKHRD